MQAGETVKVRNPEAVRPWQHVLNPLSGYLRLARGAVALERDATQAWNFGPREGDARTVRWIVERLEELWGGAFQMGVGREREPAGGGLSGARLEQGRATLWAGALEWDLGQALERIVQWHEAERRGEDMRGVSLDQIEQFELARSYHLPGFD